MFSKLSVNSYQNIINRVQCSLSKAVIELDHLPEKMNPVVRPLMECMKKEENINLQVGIVVM